MSTTVYRFFADHELLYVGITCSPTSRWREHESGKDWWPQVTTVTVEHCSTRAGALLAEAIAIRYERPKYNIRGRNGASLPTPDSETIGAIFDALFCYGEERQCWANPWGLECYTGCPAELLIASCLVLRDRGVIDLRFEDGETLYVAQRERAA